MSLFKEITIDGESQGVTTLHEVETPLLITMEIPASIARLSTGYTREYQMLRIHEGDVTELALTENDDGTISFETDRFSTYACLQGYKTA